MQRRYENANAPTHALFISKICELLIAAVVRVLSYGSPLLYALNVICFRPPLAVFKHVRVFGICVVDIFRRKWCSLYLVLAQTFPVVLYIYVVYVLPCSRSNTLRPCRCCRHRQCSPVPRGEAAAPLARRACRVAAVPAQSPDRPGRGCARWGRGAGRRGASARVVARVCVQEHFALRCLAAHTAAPGRPPAVRVQHRLRQPEPQQWLAEVFDGL